MFVLPCSFRPVRHTELLIIAAAASSSSMVYDDVEKCYAEVRIDTEALIDNALRVLYLGSPHFHPPLFAHNTTPRDVVCMPLGDGGTSSENVLLQTTSDGKDGCIVLEGGASVDSPFPARFALT
jgi:hypothetical protein